MMELRHLRYFIAVAEERNFTRAANRLGIAQPPLSRQIRELEEELGVTLFHRDARPIKLTEAGRICYESASHLTASVEQLRRTMREFSRNERKRFVIGFVGSIIYGPMPALIRTFGERMPRLEIDLLELTTLEQVAALKDGRINAGLGRVRVDDPAIRREVLQSEPLMVALPVDHVLAQESTPLSLQRLSQETLIIYPSRPRPSYADQVLAILQDHGLRPSFKEVQEVQAALGLVAANVGVALVPRSVSRSRRDDVIYVEVDEADATSPVILSVRANDISEETIAFEEVCRRGYL